MSKPTSAKASAGKRNIRKIAVLGSGVMGSRIACHFANIGAEVLLLDIAQKEGNDRNKIVNDAVDAAAATNDEAAKKSAYATIQTEIVRDLPYIPLMINATQTFYNTRDFTGWPTEDNLYAFPPSWGSVAAGYVLQQVTQK